MYTQAMIYGILGGVKTYKEIDPTLPRHVIGASPIADAPKSGHIMGSTAWYVTKLDRDDLYLLQIRRDYLLAQNKGVLIAYSEPVPWDITAQKMAQDQWNSISPKPITSLDIASADLDGKIADFLTHNSLIALEWIDLRPYESLNLLGNVIGNEIMQHPPSRPG